MVQSEKRMEKFADLLFYFVAQFGKEGVVETKLMKLLYFAEASYYRENKKTITDIDYFKNFFGPTPDIKVLQKTKSKLKKFLVVESKIYKDRTIKIYKVKSGDYFYTSLSEKDRKVAEDIFKLYSKLPSEQLSKLSHLDPPYLAAKPKGKIDFKFVLYRKEEDEFEPPLSSENQIQCQRDITQDNLSRFFRYAKEFSAI